MTPKNKAIVFHLRPFAAWHRRALRCAHQWSAPGTALMLMSVFGLGSVDAQDSFPQRPVRWIAPVLAGGAGDLIARAMAPKLTELWGQQVIIDNRVGGGGTLGMGIAARMAPDGYTIVLGVSSFVVMAPGIYPKLAYDTQKDFSAITQILAAPLVLLANNSFPAKSVTELIALAKAKPGLVSYGSPGNGSAAHLASELFRFMSGTKMLHVPYRGAPPVYTDLIAGQITLYMGTVPAAMPLTKAGRLKALASTGFKRSRVYPSLPTVSESGLPGYDVTTWYGVLAPIGVPPPILSKIHVDMMRVIRLPEIEERFASEGGDIIGSKPEAFSVFIAQELGKWAKIAKAELRSTSPPIRLDFANAAYGKI
jgi:tripartite-type tricarboxylate transporter receptor subunit TctC